jgi:predicted MFS family arabinose efflux permease
MSSLAAATATLNATPLRRTMSPAQGLWLLASLLFTFFGAASAPSPLYALYRQAWGFSALTLTWVFAIYALTLLATLLVLGRLSDYRGRRPVIFAAVLLEIVSLLLFWHAQSVVWLLAARALQGVATGIAASSLSAGLLDLHSERGALVNSAAPMLGTALGALGASLLVQFAPAPTEVVFDVLLVAFALQAVGVLFMPETVTRRPLAWSSLKPSFEVPVPARRTMWLSLPGTTVQWALAGLYLSLGPSLTRSISGSDAPVMGGALIAVLLTSAALTVLQVQRRDARAIVNAGAVLLATGLVLTLAGIEARSLWLLFAGTAVAGTGFGATFNGTVRRLVPLAAAHERAGLMSSFLAQSYLAFSLPAIAAGVAVGHAGLHLTAVGYCAALIVLSLASVVLVRR